MIEDQLVWLPGIYNFDYKSLPINGRAAEYPLRPFMSVTETGAVEPLQK
jgi:hypothetical protein